MNTDVFASHRHSYFNPEESISSSAFSYIMVGFGGTINGQYPIEMCNGFEPEDFREFERFDYNIKWSEEDFEMQIFDKGTKTVAGIA